MQWVSVLDSMLLKAVQDLFPHCKFALFNLDHELLEGRCHICLLHLIWL